MGRTSSKTARTTALAAVVVSCAGAGAFATTTLRRSATASVIAIPPLPADLASTGLYADWGARMVAAANRPFTPQYPLWSDGATKQRWVYLPEGATIEASSADAWQLPVGTKLWKEFSFGRPVETRYMERTAAGWRFATYVWSDDGRAATLASPRGSRATADVAPGVRHQIPSDGDCRVCHGNGKTPVLGFSALQLSGDRDPGAVHRERVAPGSLDLPALVEAGALRGFRGTTSPRIAARTPNERAALGYLHTNCGTCHRHDGPLAPLGMVLASSTSELHDDGGNNAVLATTLDRASRVAPAKMRIASRAPARSVLVERMRSRAPVMQMPPLGTQLVDEDAVQLLTSWIEHLEH